MMVPTILPLVCPWCRARLVGRATLVLAVTCAGMAFDHAAGMRRDGTLIDPDGIAASGACHDVLCGNCLESLSPEDELRLAA